jgi:hypothetical protein
MFSFNFKTTQDDVHLVQELLGEHCSVKSRVSGSRVLGVINSNDEECIKGTRDRFMRKGMQVGSVQEQNTRKASIAFSLFTEALDKSGSL